ncbi:MAG TPA: RnfABCDGE type electron transport complex subunit B [Methylibium sp.]|nr:RnfABCDGE type electron transport complex subunit B [Methylibium sp.]
MSTARPAAVDAIDALLPQTQCTRCGYPDCHGYAEAIASGTADIDRCPPGGAEGIARLAALTGRTPKPLDAACGREGPRRLAVIDEAACIGCTRCIEACPVACIVGAAKRMHTVIEPLCTGCELCLPACPVDCIALEDATPGVSGWAAWSASQAEQARERYRERQARRERDRQAQRERLDARSAALASPSGGTDDARRAAAAAALARARKRRER